MAAIQNFRNAFHGFHREDVVRYIEYTTNKHNSQVNQLKTQLQNQSEELESLRAELERTPDLQEQLQSANAQLEEKTAQLEALNREAEELRAARESLTRDLEEAKLQLEQAREDKASSELEAYRRAERAERLAAERASRMYEQINAVLADATVRTDDTAVSLGEATDRIVAQLSELQSLLLQSKSSLKEAASTLYAIRPAAPEE